VLLALAGFAWFLGTLGGSSVGVVAMVGTTLLTLHRGPLLHAVVGYPNGQASDRLGFLAMLMGYAYAATVGVARNDVVTIVVVSLVLAATIRGYASAAGPERRARMTALVAAVTLSLPLAGGSAERLARAGQEVEQAVLWAYEAAIVLVAIILLVDLLFGQWARETVTRLVVDLGEGSESGTVQARLARALGDQSLSIAYWVPEANGYVDEGGTPVTLPQAGSGKAVTEMEQQGERIGVLVHEASVSEEPGLVEAVASAAKIALSNVRLRAEVRRQVAELDASRRRILEAGDAQRQRLQQELRAGAGQRLEEVRELLNLALEEARSASDRLEAPGLEDALREARAAQVELQELAAGIHPVLLTEGGLGSALSSLAERALVPVRMVVSTQRLPAAVETAIYFLCSEALTNVAKYARASRVDIEVMAETNVAAVLVADDGVGGADPAAGSGLAGIADRIEALGGRLVVDSSAGNGTRLRAEIPTGAAP
jgi:signal transduction histidine kinase